MWIWMMILLLKTCELTVESLRLLLYVHGQRLWGCVLAFVDVLLGLMALSFVVSHLTDWHAYLSYAGGYTAGSYLGSVLYERLVGGPKGTL
jgi:uncharacterized protein YebE (UPF0316 family)